MIFFGNGPLATAAFSVLKERTEVIFWAKKKEDLEEVKKIARGGEQKIYAVLASFGVLIKKDVLELFEPEGILNIHPSRLPDLRGPSPIETAILRGDTEFYVSVMKLALEMDAGPVYHQEGKKFDKLVPKAEIYEALGKMGAEWITSNLEDLPEPIAQNEKMATYCKKLDTSMAFLRPLEQGAEEMLDQIRAFSGFPKTRMEIFGMDCIILSAHLANEPEIIKGHTELSIKGKDEVYLVIDSLQPAGRKVMDAKSFVNGYGHA